MEIIATDRLSSAYLRKISRYNYFAITGAILIVTVSALWMLFHIGGAHINTLFADAGYAIAAFIGAIWAYQTAFSGRFGPVRLASRHQLAWLLIGLGLTSDGLGGSYYFYLEYIHMQPFPSPSDVLFNLMYPLIFAGILLMPTKLRFRTRMALDACITTFCILGISWFFLIGPSYVNQRNQVPQLELFTALSYPIWDIVLILAIVLLIQRRTEALLRGSLIILGLGILSTVWADSGYAYLNVFSTYTSGTIYIDPFWMIYSLLVGISALTQYETLVRHSYKTQTLLHSYLKQNDELLYKYNEKRSKSWRSLSSMIIYIPLIVLLGLTVYSEYFHDGEVSHVLVFITAIVGILVTFRYVLATHENEVLLQEREHKHAESEHLRYLSTRLTDILEIEQLQEQIVTLAVTELAFAAAMLISVEEREQRISQQSHLLVNTAMTTSPQANQTILRESDLYRTNWRFQGDNILYHTMMAGKVTEVAWSDHLLETPEEIQIWREDARVPSLVFFPLIYQDKILGCLGVAHRAATSLSHLSLHDISLMKAYTEQVAVAIEHAQLYRERREHEGFARSLATIATRLNAAVVDPTEIQQLICKEAAYALHADYTLLYVADSTERLVPITASIDGHISMTPQEDWPPISLHEWEAQALREQQPTLLHIQYPSPRSTNPLPVISTSSKHMAIQPQTPSSQTAPLRSLTSPMSLHKQSRFPHVLTLQHLLALHFVQSAVLAPLITNGRTVGLLVLARSVPPSTRDKKSFDEASLPQIQDFVEQAAVAFTNAQLYQRLHTAHRQLQELDQLKDQFMITASHELRTPLTAVQGYIELMAEYGDILPLDQRHEFLQKARRSCDELVVMLGNVMDASRLEVEAGIRQAQMERVPVRTMLDSVVELIEPQLTQQRREVHIHVPLQLAVVADAARLRQVVMNISVNALKYSPAHTPLLYTAQTIIDRIPCVLISITDKGNGIALQEQGKLFQRFYRLERDVNSAVRGSGLGLYISRRLIEAMGGKIWVESRGIPGDGSTFHIQLPLAQ